MVSGYSARQIALHWIVVALIAFQFVMGDNMTELVDAAHHGKPTNVPPIWTAIHIVVGVAILAAMLWRLELRFRDGAPASVPQNPALAFLAKAVHVGLYIDFIGAALVGLAAYFWLPQLGDVHDVMVRQVLLVLVGLHVLGALYHWAVKNDGVMMRMIRPAR